MIKEDEIYRKDAFCWSIQHIIFILFNSIDDLHLLWDASVVLCIEFDRNLIYTSLYTMYILMYDRGCTLHSVYIVYPIIGYATEYIFRPPSNASYITKTFLFRTFFFAKFTHNRSHRKSCLFDWINFEFNIF